MLKPVWSFYRCELCKPVEKSVIQAGITRPLVGTHGSIKNPPLCPYTFVKLNDDGRLYNRRRRFSGASLDWLKR
jgi:hypothetical protein